MQRKEQKHIIHRQVVDLHLKDESKAREWQNRISAFCHDEIIPALEKVCDELSPSGEHIRIDHLELTLDPIKNNDLRPELALKLAKGFKEKLINLSVKQLQLMVDDKEGESLPSGVTLAADQNSSDAEALLHYIQYGLFPWWYASGSKNAKELVDRLSDHKMHFPVQRVVELSSQTQSRLRIIHLFNEEQLFQCYDASGKYRLRELYNDLNQLLQADNLKTTFFQEFMTNVVLRKSDKRLEINQTQAIVNILSMFGYAFHNLPDFKLKASERLNEEALLYRLLNDNLDHVKPSYTTKKDDTTRELGGQAHNAQADKGVDTTRSKAQNKQNGGDISRFEPKKTQVTASLSDSLPQLSPGESLAIENAGVVILWPYLQLFFKELGLVDSKAFIDGKSQLKAVQVLHYLVSGNQEGEEYQWVLLKLLCGVKVPVFVSPDFQLTDNEQQECKNLLKAVIRNWNVLKKTSPAGLQSSFLQRPGLLKRDNNGWVLHIERTTIDVLIDKLSWPISVIRLPWNEYSIHVKW